MDFFEVVKHRMSVREYSSKAISQEALKIIVDAARHAPTARKVQPWEFVVIQKRATLEKLGQIADHGRFITDAQAAIVVLCKETKYYLEDGSAATENILLAATALGIGSCWVAGDKKEYAKDVIVCIRAPKEYLLVSIISLGYPRDESCPYQKRDLREVIHFEQW